MGWIERLERIGRLILWLSLASAAVLAPISYIRLRRSEAEQLEAARVEVQAEAAKRAAAELAEKQTAAKPLSLATMGTYLSALDVADGAGFLWFTNVSPRSGAICVVGVAQNPGTQRTTTSLAACHEVPPYGSAIKVPFMFAGAELKDVCPTQSACVVKVKDAT